MTSFKGISLFLFLLGLFLGYSCFYYLNLSATPDQVSYAEDFLRTSHKMPIMTQDMTLRDLNYYYFHYDFISRSLLTRHIENLCGSHPISHSPSPSFTNVTLTFCTDFCSPVLNSSLPSFVNISSSSSLPSYTLDFPLEVSP